MRRTLVRLTAATALTVLMLSGGTAFAQPNQPTNVSNSEGRPEFATPSQAPIPPLQEGPHCHFVQAAGGNESFDGIIAAPRHHAHVLTNNAVGPNEVFMATECP